MLRMVTSAGIQVKRKFGQHMLCHTCTAIENLYNFDSCICSLPHVDIIINTEFENSHTAHVQTIIE